METKIITKKIFKLWREVHSLRKQKKPTLLIVSFEVFSKISTSLTDVKVNNNYMSGFYNNIEIRADKLCSDNVIIKRKLYTEEK